MNEKNLIEQVLRLINANYSNIYVIDIESDRVYAFAFTVTNSLVIKETITFTDFIEIATRFIHEADVGVYFSALSITKVTREAQMGNNETKVKYRKLCETGEYRWYVNIINYLPFEGRKLIFMMSEDINDRLINTEEDNIRLESEVVNYKNRITKESESIGDAVYQINTLFDNTNSKDSLSTKEYINSLFKRVGADHPELNQALNAKLVNVKNYQQPSILIVDDSTIIRNSLKRIFEKNYNILIAKNGNEAIDIITKNVLTTDNLKKENIVGVLLDLVMPVSDGFVVLDFFKNFNLFNHIPVAIISGDETRETRKKVYQYDIVDMLEKPFNTEVIRTRFNKIINLYLSSNNLASLLENSKKDVGLSTVMQKIMENINASAYSNRLKQMAKIIANYLATNYPKYQLDNKYVDNIILGIPYYNIGAIAIKENEIITSRTIKEEIEYSLIIIEELISDYALKNVIKNIIIGSCEMFNGSGYPDGIKGNDIPIEAQITNIVVRLCNKGKAVQTTIKNILENESDKYNPDLIACLNETKKDLKKV